MYSAGAVTRRLARIGARMLLMLVFLLALGREMQSQTSVEPYDALQQLSKSLERLMDKVCPGVVQLQVSAYSTDSKAPGDRVTIQVLRGQKLIDLELTLEEHLEEPNPDARPANPDKNLVEELGILGVDVDPEMVKALPGIREASGVLVSGKTKLAERMEIDLRAGDIIHTLNRKKIRSLSDLSREIKSLKPGDAVVLQIERKRKLLYVSFELD